MPTTPPGAPPPPDTDWWRTAVLYQVYVRSFADSNDDGVGDLPGLLGRLDHLAWLGVDGVWLSPVMPSPNADWGYDVADYRAVLREYGTLDDLDEVIAAAGRLGIRVLLDLVPNHTSDHHQWFVESRSSVDSARRDWYVWADPRPDGSAPNNWVGSFGGPAWSLDEASGQYYLHNFLPEQPDLNWWNDGVRDAFDDIARFWWDRGVAGFRIDVCNMMIKDAALRDNPPATEDDPFIIQMFGQRPIYNGNRPEAHDILRRWRTISESYSPPRVLLGETNVDTLENLATYYGSGDDELHMGFNFPFIEAPFEAGALSDVVGRTEALLPATAWPVWTGSNHDVSRLASRWCQGDPAKVRLALLMLLTLRGTPVLYQGDEIGLTDREFEQEELLDPVGERFWPYYPGRDPERTPMQWDDGENAGFTSPGVTPWIPMADAPMHVAGQRAEPDSVLHFVRDTIALRRRTPELLGGDYQSPPVHDDLWVWRRGGVVVALNFSASRREISVGGTPTTTVALSTHRAAEGPVVEGKVDLDPFQGVVVTSRA